MMARVDDRPEAPGTLEIRGPATGLLDDPLVLQARGAGRGAELVWRARLRDDDGRVWRATAPTAERLGATWAPSKSGSAAIAALTSLHPVTIDVRVQAPDGRTAARTLTRVLLADGVRRRRWRDGLAAALYLPAGPAPCAVLLADATGCRRRGGGRDARRAPAGLPRRARARGHDGPRSGHARRAAACGVRAPQALAGSAAGVRVVPVAAPGMPTPRRARRRPAAGVATAAPDPGRPRAAPPRRDRCSRTWARARACGPRRPDPRRADAPAGATGAPAGRSAGVEAPACARVGVRLGRLERLAQLPAQLRRVLVAVHRSRRARPRPVSLRPARHHRSACSCSRWEPGGSRPSSAPWAGPPWGSPDRPPEARLASRAAGDSALWACRSAQAVGDVCGLTRSMRRATPAWRSWGIGLSQ